MNTLRSIISLSILIAFTAPSPAQGTSAGAEEFTVNGLKVILKPNAANEIISAQLYLRGGALNISEATQGIEPLIFNSALKGTRNYSKDALNELLDKTGALINSASSRDYSMISLRCLRRDFDATWAAFADVIINPTFDPGEVEIVRKNLLLGIRQRMDSPDGNLNEVSDELFFKNHAYRLTPSGTEEAVSGLTIDQMRKHLAQNLVTSKLLLVLVGNVTRDELQKKVAESFGKLPKGQYKPSYPARVRHSTPSLKMVERQLPTNYIVGCFATPRLGDPDYYAATVAMDILAFRVFEEVRTKRNLSYAPSAYLAGELANRGAIYVTTVRPDTTIKVMLAEVKKLRNERVSQKDLSDRVAIFLTRYYLRNETNDSQARFLATYELSGIGWREADRFVGSIRKVTADEVQHFAKTYFHSLQFAVVGNPKLIDEKLFTSL